MHVLVTGGTGTLGRELVPVLRSRGHRVRVLSRRVSIVGAPLEAGALTCPVRADGAVTWEQYLEGR